MENLELITKTAADFAWGLPMLFLLVGTHLFLTFRLRFIQSYTFKAIKLSLTKDKSGDGDISQFGALATSLAATIGTGNIVGVATAIISGGPGAVFWCWITGLFGIATKYAEGLLAVKYRVKTSDGTMLGGPMYALERGLKARWLGVLFAFFTVVASFGIGNMTQGNSITQAVSTSYGISPYVIGIVITIAAAFVIIGGVKSIAKVCESLIPFMALFYILGCIIVLIANAKFVPQAFVVIIQSAFTPRAAMGGFIGSTVIIAMRSGVSRGLFSNESGLGSAPIAAAAAQTANPVRQALVSMTGVFWDTIVVCALTGLVLTSSILRFPNELAAKEAPELTANAFRLVHGEIGKFIIVVALITFAFSTILGWSYYGEKAFEYLWGKKASKIYRLIYCAVVFVGCISKLTVVWNISDLFNALMAAPNLICLIFLSPIIVSETKKYLWENQLDMVDDSPIPQIHD